MAFGFGGGRIVVVALRGVAQTQKSRHPGEHQLFLYWVAGTADVEARANRWPSGLGAGVSRLLRCEVSPRHKKADTLVSIGFFYIW